IVLKKSVLVALLSIVIEAGVVADARGRGLPRVTVNLQELIVVAADAIACGALIGLNQLGHATYVRSNFGAALWVRSLHGLECRGELVPSQATELIKRREQSCCGHICIGQFVLMQLLYDLATVVVDLVYVLLHCI